MYQKLLLLLFAMNSIVIIFVTNMLHFPSTLLIVLFFITNLIYVYEE